MSRSKHPIGFTLLTLGALIAWADIAQAQVSDDIVKIGVLDGLSGPYADLQGPGDVVAARMAVEDFGGKVLGKPVEVVAGDLQHKVDVGSTIARRWYDQEKVDAIFGLGDSAVALAVQDITREKDRINIVIAAGTPALTGKNCSPNGIHWTYDNYAIPRATALATLKDGGNTWFFITADYAFGQSLEESTRRVVEGSGGKVVGGVRAPINTTDFSSFILQAQASGAKVIGLANAGADMTNTMKQLVEFGVAGNRQRPVGLLVTLTDVHSLGLKAAQGLTFTEAFYWDQTPETRAFSKRFQAIHGKPPTMMQASIYGAVMHYLKAVQGTGTDGAKPVMAKMKATPINDFMTKNGEVRADGRVIRDLYLFRVKKPEESKGEWDLLEQVATIPGKDAFRPMSEGGCPLVSGQ
ncbi:ABC transporter substrate-binding protein [Xanthobacter aminoxidans]|uniref:ABC transporter substrate-binding protein n=1 Tax=Xanthobacter aminoxidans TaxID=186280 RepID=A0ABW6ZQL0_9HYPH|nr:ABC transporter substrate-binding protein [Xanthobacter aminoxidans]MCL8383565.1 ABC transporter substrate-binding protein [Xanthobacter aminoxidans]